MLITGETGTGKELVAGLIHAASPRQPQAVRLDQLRGDPRHAARERAVRLRARRVHRARIDATPGRAEVAHDGGTVFFDEIGDMRLPAQAKILRAIETREVHPLGGRVRVPLESA